MFWAYGSYVAGRLLVLVSISILARVLTPSEFGLVAFAAVVTTVLDTVSDLGVSQALILVDDEEVEEKADTAWTLGMILGVALCLITAALGPVAATFFDEPALTVMLPVLGFNFILRAAGVTHFALAQKQINFRTRTIAELSDVVVRGGLGIALALAGAGAYSLVGGYLAGSAAMTIALWTLVRWRPSVRIRRADLAGLLRFGGGVTLLDIISMVVTNVDYLAVGRVLGKFQLGLYTLGFRLPQLLILNLSVVAGLVLFPAFAAVERTALAAAYLTSLRYLLMLSIPMAVLLYLLAEPIVLVAFGPKWLGAVSAMQVLTLYSFALTIGFPAGIAYKSIGRVDILIKLAVPHAVLVIVGIVLFVDRGILAVAYCQAVGAALWSIASIALAARMLHTGLRAIWAAAFPSLVAGVALAAVIAGLSTVVDNQYLELALAVPLGGLTYIAGLWLIAPDFLRDLWNKAFGSRDSATPATEPTALAGDQPLGDS